MFRPNDASGAAAAPITARGERRPRPSRSPDTSIELAEGLSRAFLLFHRLCPIRVTDDGTLLVAVTDGTQEGGLSDLSIAYRRPVETRYASREELELRIERLTSDSARTDEPSWAAAEDLDADFAPDIEDLANQPPVVRYVNLLVREAYEAGASDIHLEQSRDRIDARIRVDGTLIEAVGPPSGMGQAVVSRVKLLAELDIAERRRPQDGRLTVRTPSGDLDLRVSTVPTLNGESVALRLLERGRGPVALGDLGMPEGIREEFSAVVRRRHGLVLVTGPTGSGKTTTLYAALRLRDRASEKILTVEDPVEYELDGIAQVPVRRATDLTFASALRSLLRQDPDVMFIGEMRDPETAEIGIQSALTGHFVFSTLHTNDAPGAIPRLLDLEIPPYLIAATVDGVLAQRLVRRICTACRESYRPSGLETDALGRVLAGAMRAGPRVKRLRGQFWRGSGCDDCRGSGFCGRIGVFEWLAMSPAVREAVARGGSEMELRRAADAAAFRPMLVDGVAKLRAGITTIEEVLSATGG